MLKNYNEGLEPQEQEGNENEGIYKDPKNKKEMKMKVYIKKMKIMSQAKIINLKIQMKNKKSKKMIAHLMMKKTMKMMATKI